MQIYPRHTLKRGNLPLFPEVLACNAKFISGVFVHQCGFLRMTHPTDGAEEPRFNLYIFEILGMWTFS